MTDYCGKTDGFRGYSEAIRLLREKGLREGRFTPQNDEERRIAEEGK